MIAAFLHDLRSTFRGLAGSRSVAVILLLTIGVGTGINATVFSLVDGLLFRPPPGLVRPSLLVRIFTSQFGGQPYGYSSYPDYVSVKAGVPALESLAAFDDSRTVALRMGEAIHSIRVAAVSPEIFTVLGLAPARGALDISSDSGAGESRAVITHAFLRKGFGGDDDPVGMTIPLDGREYTIVGVLPDGFDGLHHGRPCDVWIPLTETSASDDRGHRRLSLVGRLARRASFEDARRQVERVAVSLSEQYPATNLGTLMQPTAPRPMTVLRYSRLDPGTRTRAALVATVLFGATMLVLFCAIASAGGIMLSRATARTREIGVRFALGATRGRLVQQLLTECLVISLAGGALGLLFARWAGDAFPSFLAPKHAELLDPRLDIRLFLFSLGTSIAAGALFGLGPAIFGTRPVAINALRSDAAGMASGVGGSGLRAALVVGQIALAVVLLAATVQLVKSLNNALTTEMGLTARHLATASVIMPGRYTNELRGLRYQSGVLAAVSKLPGVEAAAWVSALPLSEDYARDFRIARPGSDLTEYAELQIGSASNGYFDAMRIPLLAGRFFDGRDNARADPVVIVNDTFAYQYFGSVDRAVGARIEDMQGTRFEIVGVVQSPIYRTLQPSPPPMINFPIVQNYIARMSLVVRTSGDPSAIADAVRRVLDGTDAAAEVVRVVTLERYLSEALALERLTTILVAGCGLMTLVLAIFGVYGVVTDGVLRRTRELGIRVALGARPVTIVTLVFVHGVRLAVAGAAAGLVFAVAASYLLQSLIQGAATLDVRTLAAIPSGLALLVLGACLLPVRRALGVNPTVALRDE